MRRQYNDNPKHPQVLMTNETKNSSTVTNEAKNTSTVTNETETNRPSVFGIARFGKSKFGQGQAGSATPHTNETKHTEP